ncbi:MAG: FHA domain-containing protein [Betaproteobacteria bacterium]
MSVVALAKSVNKEEVVAAVPSPPLSTSPRRQNVLRVLSGAHLGAEVPVTAERLLVGNLDSECDLVLDVGRSERHACLLRISSDGWTALAIAGDLWIGNDHLATQQTRPLLPGQPLTLGRIAFAVGEAGTDWESVRPPLELLKPEATGAVPVAPAIGPRRRVMQGWKALRLAAGVGLGALILAASLSYITSVLQSSEAPEAEAARRLDRARVVLAALPAAREVEAIPDPERRGLIRLVGYVSTSDDAERIEAALSDAKLAITRRLTTVSAMQVELGRRVSSAEAASMRYVAKGVFSLSSEASRLLGLDGALRTALHELPEVGGFQIQVNDIIGPTESNIVINYRRSPERFSDIVVDEADLVKRTRARFVIRELRLGPMPSALFGDGRTYFAGSQLSEGWVLESILADRIILRLGEKSRIVALPDGVARGK